ncbi:MAG: hypothetical protein ACPHN3_07750 [Spongiibacter sp.]
MKKIVLRIFPKRHSDSEDFARSMVAKYASGSTSLQHKSYTTQKGLDELKAKAQTIDFS